MESTIKYVKIIKKDEDNNDIPYFYIKNKENDDLYDVPPPEYKSPRKLIKSSKHLGNSKQHDNFITDEDKILKEYENSQYNDIISKNNELDKILKEYGKKEYGKKGCRILNKCFTNGDRIRHIIKYKYGPDSCWEGIYLDNKIIYDGKIYKSLSGFSGEHYKIENPNRTSSSNGWSECEYKVNGKWISTFNISEK